LAQEWDVFFSHSTRRDGNPRTDRLIEGVYLRLTRGGRKVFLDRECAMPEPTLVQALRDRLDHSRIAVLFINRLFWKSPWVELELDHITRRLTGGRIRVLCLRTEPEEPIPRCCASATDVFDVGPTAPISESVRLISKRLNHMLDSAG
jgi:TIR domain